MTTFPSLTPNSRTFTPGEYPHSPFAGMNGKQNRTRHSNVMLSSQLRLSFTAITEADMLSILSHYKDQLGTFSSFPLPSTVWGGVSSSSDFQLSGYGWRYIQPPSVEDLVRGRHNVELVLETVPPEGTALAGLARKLTFSVTAGIAAAANGAALSFSTSFSPGAGYVVLTGLAESVDWSLESGTAEGTIGGLNATVTFAIESGTAGAANGLDRTVTCSVTGGSAVGTGTAFKTFTYTGNATARSFSDLGFKPGLVMLHRARPAETTATAYVYDKVRGATKSWITSLNSVAETDSQALVSFDSSGFSLGTSARTNQSGTTHTAYCWQEGGAPSTNTDGTLTSTVVAAPGVGYSVFTYVGTYTDNATVGHGLGVNPELVIIKAQAVETRLAVAHSRLVGNNRYGDFETSSWGTSSSIIKQTSSSVITFGLSGRVNSYLANHFYAGYAFVSVPGVSKIATYTGAGTGVHSIDVGFQPRFVMVKTYNVSGNWFVYSPPEGGTGYATYVYWDTASNRATSANFQITSTGFSIDVGGPGNVSGGTSSAIYMAYA